MLRRTGRADKPSTPTVYQKIGTKFNSQKSLDVVSSGLPVRLQSKSVTISSCCPSIAAYLLIRWFGISHDKAALTLVEVTIVQVVG